jgi:hypothetical protein
MGKMNYLTKILLLSGALAPTLIDPIHLSMTLKARELD